MIFPWIIEFWIICSIVTSRNEPPKIRNQIENKLDSTFMCYSVFSHWCCHCKLCSILLSVWFLFLLFLCFLNKINVYYRLPSDIPIFDSHFFVYAFVEVRKREYVNVVVRFVCVCHQSVWWVCFVLSVFFVFLLIFSDRAIVQSWIKHRNMIRKHLKKSENYVTFLIVSNQNGKITIKI